MSSERRDYRKKLESMGFRLIRDKKHLIFQHPSGAVACGPKTASDYHSLKNSIMDARKSLREHGVDPDAVPAKPQQTPPVPVISAPAPAPTGAFSFPVVTVPDRITTKAPPPVLSDFRDSRTWCVQIHCYGRWVCIEQQRAPTPEGALKQCALDVRDWYTKANKAGKSRIEPKES